jgi:type III pantothenate kinase
VLLAVNVGNTNTVLGVFRGSELEHQWRLSTETERTADELAVLFAGLLDQTGLSFSNQITGVVISSVVPSSTTALRDMVTRQGRVGGLDTRRDRRSGGTPWTRSNPA